MHCHKCKESIDLDLTEAEEKEIIDGGCVLVCIECCKAFKDFMERMDKRA